MKSILTYLFTLSFFCVYAQKNKNTYVEITTTKGIMIAKLYNETPEYRDNFVKLTKKKFYNDLLFHRIIKGFMIQTGDPNSKHAEAGAALGNGGVEYTIPANFQDQLFHKKGALAAARDNNPEKNSSGCQFYIVQGTTYTDPLLTNIEQSKNLKYSEIQRNTYINKGGAPFLDKNYTVFGEVVKGLDVIDSIAVLPTDERDRPKDDISMKIKVLKRRMVKKLEKELLKEALHKQIIMKN